MSSAEWLAEHAIASLVALTLLLLGAVALLWVVLMRFGGAWWRSFAALWQRAMSTRVARRLAKLPLLQPVLTRSLTLWRYLGLQAILAFAVAACGLSLFSELVDEIGVGEAFAQFDEQLSAALGRSLSTSELQVFAQLTHLGDLGFLSVLTAIIAMVLVIRREPRMAVVWIVAIAGGGLLVRMLKALFERTRPIHEHALTSVEGWSFPSGHASGSVLVYGLLGYLVIRHTRAMWHVPATLLMLGLIVFVGFSRVLLQVHYLSDVLAGFAVAGAWLAIWIAALEAWRHRSKRRSANANAATHSEETLSSPS